MNYQALKFIVVCLEGLLNGEGVDPEDRSAEFTEAIRNMLEATKKLMRFF